jgi:chemotaxis signal transduction protein
MTMKNHTHQKSINILTFRRCGVPFAVEVDDVREIRKFDHLRPLALAIQPLVGVVSQGARIIPVFDPHAFGATARRGSPGALTTIVCSRSGTELALLADEVQNQAVASGDQFRRRTGDGAEWLQGEIQVSPGHKLLLLALDHLARLAAVGENEPDFEPQPA